MPRSVWVVAVLAATTGATFAGGPFSIQPKMGDPIQGLTPDQQTRFDVGRTQFGRVFEQLDGLGPVYTNLGCGLCHENPLGGTGDAFVTNLGHWDGETFDPLVDLGGPTLQPISNDDLCDETLPAEANFTATRVTPGALGFGLIEAIPDAALLALEQSPPGISGRANMVEALEDPGVLRVGRFGWKSQLPTILSFSADASRNEIGLTNRLLMTDPEPNGIPDPVCDDVPDPEDGPDGEGFDFIDRVTDFQRFLAPPPRTPRSGMTGETVFNTVGCDQCHTPEFTTADDPGLEDALRNKVIRPYSDFLLHDMGDNGDGIEQGDAGRWEMRTSPLWGIRQQDILWHDGRFDDPDFAVRVADAINAHDAPGSEAAAVAQAYAVLAPEDQAALIAFLDSLGRREFDSTGDNLIRFEDFIAFAACHGGTGYTPDDPCAVFDIDQDGDVDGDDFADFLVVYEGTLEDCNENGTADIEEIISGAVLDLNGNGIPDECDPCPGDITGPVGDPDDLIDFFDLLAVLSAWGPCTGCPADIDGSGDVGFTDLLAVLAAWGPCQLGACCLEDGSCVETDFEGCTSLGGVFSGLGNDCASAACATPGACCLSDGTCVQATELGGGDCAGVYQGDGTDCGSASCPQPGACCFDDGSCTFVFAADCTAAGGTPQGDQVTCATASCPAPGACCFGDGSCTFVFASDCTAAGGTPQGDQVTCATASCPAPGACCFDDGSCTFVFASDCGAAGGTPQGDQVTCGAAACPQPGACCFGDGSCTFVFASDCTAAGGTPQGDQVTCASAACPQPGACCFGDGSCTFVFSVDCASAGGTYQGDGVTCASASCLAPGACCFGDGSCTFVFSVDCASAGGTYQGDGVTCASASCLAPGACCFSDGSCSIENEVDCLAAGGGFVGGGASCAGACAQPTLMIDTIAGTGAAGFDGDGGPAADAELRKPEGVAVDGAGNIVFADKDNNRVRRIDAMTGIISTVVGTGSAGGAGDGGPATAAELNKPEDVFLDGTGDLYIADTNGHRIRRVDGATGIITTVAGTGSAGDAGDGGPATAASVDKPRGVFVDGAGNIFIADTNNHRVRRVDGATGIITTVAGTGGSGFAGDGGPATAAELDDPADVYLDASGTMYISDQTNNRIRRVDGVTGVITTIAGTGNAAFSGDGGQATAADIRKPAGLVLSSDEGLLLIADRDNNRIRRIDLLTGVITTLAGDGNSTYGGDGGPAIDASLKKPVGVAFDSDGDLIIGDTENSRLREVDLAVTP